MTTEDPTQTPRPLDLSRSSDGEGSPLADRTRGLFEELAGLDPDERSARLDALRRASPQIAERLDDLLNAHEGASDWLRTGAADAWGQLALDLTGAEIGGYRVLQRIGVGGMGEVYEAEQGSPPRSVALKVMRVGVRDERALRRFDHEAEALGRLDHDGIARIFHAGHAQTDAGPLPFFAMELVRGVPIDAYAHTLSTRDRLELLARVADAVQHAHHKGVIHRDLKPDNLLVTPDGRPKILDFGIARLAREDGDAVALLTREGELVGTLAYMSPEQVSGGPNAVDTRTDVYALGVVGFELLTGRLPKDVRGKAPSEAVHILARSEPTALGQVQRAFRGDLDTIFRKALEQDKARRYGSAGEFAADLRRYLAHEPIHARPQRAFYQLTRLARRHRALVGGAVVAIVGLVIGTGVAIQKAIDADRERAVAVAVRSFMEDVFRLAHPLRTGRPDLPMRGALDVAAERLEQDFLDQPAAKAAIYLSLSDAYAGLSLHEEAERCARASLSLADGDPARKEARRALAWAQGGQGNGAESRASWRAVIEADDADGDEELAAAARLELARLHVEDSELTQAEEPLKRALAWYEQVGRTQERRYVRGLAVRGNLARREGRLDDAERDLQDASRRAALLSDDHALGGEVGDYLALLLRDQGRYAEAVLVCHEAIAHSTHIWGDESEHVAHKRATLAHMLTVLARFDEAEVQFRSALEILARTLGEDSSIVANIHSGLATLLQRTGRLADAAPLFERVLKIQERDTGARSLGSAIARNNLALVLDDLGRDEEAEAMYREVISVLVEVSGEDHPYVGLGLRNLAGAMADQGRRREAIAVYEDSIAACERTLGASHAETGGATVGLADVLAELGDAAAAAEHYATGAAILAAALGDEHPEVRRVQWKLADKWISLGRAEEARELLLVHMQRLKPDASPGEVERVQTLLHRCEAHAEEGG